MTEYSTLRRKARCTNDDCPRSQEPEEFPLPLIRPGFAYVPSELLCTSCGSPAEVLSE